MDESKKEGEGRESVATLRIIACMNVWTSHEWKRKPQMTQWNSDWVEERKPYYRKEQSKLMYREEELRTLGKMAKKSKNYHDECRLNE